MERRKSKVILLSCMIIVILLVALLLGCLIVNIYYNAEILSCDFYKATSYEHQYYEFKVYGSGKMIVTKYEHIRTLKLEDDDDYINKTIKFDSVNGLKLKDSGERYLSFKEHFNILLLMFQLNHSKYGEYHVMGMVLYARLNFCGNSYTQYYDKPYDIRTKADNLAIKLIDTLIQSAPIEVDKKSLQ